MSTRTSTPVPRSGVASARRCSAARCSLPGGNLPVAVTTRHQGTRRPVPAHHGAHQARTAVAQILRDLSVRHHASRRDLLDDPQHGLDVRLEALGQ